MKVDIHICSFYKHFNYLFYCLKSIVKFTEGFNSVKLFIPDRDIDLFYNKVTDDIKPYLGNFIDVITFKEWENKGMLHHEYIVCNADIYSIDADCILHFDSDCIFTDTMNANEFIEDNKLIQIYTPYETLIKIQPNYINWKIAVESCLGWSPENEFMRTSFLIYRKELYKLTRHLIEKHTNSSLEEYVKKQRNEFPQTFAEYNTLGEVAWKFYNKDYFWLNTNEFVPEKIWERDRKIRRMWSHRDPTHEDMEIFNKLGLT